MVLATLPATPVQLAHACHALGFDIVIPASWGDELVAHAVLEEAAGRAREPVIQCTCPLVAERLRASGAHLEPYMVACVAPPVAAARYVRQAFSPRSVHVSYFGACPAAADPAIDAHYTPDEVIRWLDERGILVRDLPTVFDSVVPPDRRRWSSLPGGSPSQDALWRSGDGRMLREVTKASFAADLAQTLVWREHVLIDVAPAVGCPCSGSHAAPGSSGGRASVMAVEPPRAAAPVVPYVSGIARLEAKPSPPRPPQNGEVAADLPVPPSRSRLGDGTPAGMPDGNRVQAHAHSARDTAVSDAAVRGLPRAYLAKRRSKAARTTPHVESRERVVTQPSAALATTPVTHASPLPNEASDLPRTIAVHIEPERLTEAHAPAPSPDYSSPAPDQYNPQQLTLPIAEASNLDLAKPATTPETDAARPHTSTNTQPLRVEIDVEDDAAAASPVTAAHTPAPGPTSMDEAEVITPAVGGAWEDVAVGLWLVLAVSAVLVALVWR